MRRRSDATATGDRTKIRFGQTQALPTYLFGFVAGKFSVERGERNGRVFHLYHRETDTAKVAANRETIFDQHQQALEWLETYTDRKYPFDKLDFVLMPAFQFSGMEHAGAIYYNAPALFLDKTATQNQLLSRANLIAHETAHMWFGDLVTMKWFDDVWLKEVFANFMAAKIVNPSFPDINHDLRFFLQHYPSAYEVDRTAGTNPIRQTLDNLREAGSLYGPIIYQKAPIVMRQLEQMLGPDELRDGLREYLTRFAFANATWADLIEILDRRTDQDLAAWSRVWVDEPGRPTIATTLETRNGKISRLTFSQSDPRGRSLLWNQKLQVALGYEHGARISELTLDGASVDVPRVNDLPLPHYVLANSEGTGYGLFKLDDASRQFFLKSLPGIGDGLTRGTAWVTLWDDMLEGGTRPRQLFDLALAALPQEPEELNTERILAYVRTTFWRYLSDEERAAVAAPLEQALRAGMKQASTASLKSAYFGAFRRTVTTPDGLAYLERVWRRQEPDSGAAVCRNRLHRHGPGARTAARAEHRCDSRRAAQEHHQSGPQSTVCVRDARACRRTRRRGTPFLRGSRASRIGRTNHGFPRAWASSITRCAGGMPSGTFSRASNCCPRFSAPAISSSRSTGPAPCSTATTPLPPPRPSNAFWRRKRTIRRVCGR